MSVSPTPSPLPPPGSPAPAPGSAAEAAAARGVDLGRRSLREHATRGVLISGVWMAIMGAVQTGRNMVLPAIVGPAEYGLWGALLVAGALLAAFRTTGANEIFVGQNEDDQERAFQRVFAIEVTVNALLMVVTIAVAPLLALMYGDDRLLLLGMATALAWPAQTLQAPLWLLNRRMAFGKLRLIQSVDPVIGTIVAIGLAVAGFGAWAIVLGILVGAWATALIAIATSPYRLRPRFDREALRRYGGISVPLWLSAVTASLVSLGLMVLARWEIGLVAVGAVTLASNLTFFAQRIDQAVSTVLYPAIAAAQDKPDVLHETFGKSNRVGLAWAIPVASLLLIFGPELVPLLYGERWNDAVPIVQWFAVAVAVAHLGTNWWQYELVQGNARPMAVNGVMALVFFAVLQVPAVLLWGLEGLAISAVAQALGQLVVRTVYVRRRFGHWSPTALALRSLLPVLPASVVGWAMLQLDVPLGPSLAAFGILMAAGTLVFERALVREIAGYLRGAVR
ncbi:oligosaccharide flippase family protein [Patulibacter defluvii]|uniref:oligosaccharide flippase family protein n=1 Tax=Patulibacter defluvii TaxID=3095358 RepID=UPI002A74D9E6|nr:oligosaccharide flippase family protein [Patulibacter sp. DM4]